MAKKPRLALRKNRFKTRTRRLWHEVLEARYVLDSATLAPDAFSLRENGPQTTLDVLANDVFTPDYSGQKLITSVSFGSEGGRIEIAADKKNILYTPPADFFGSETFVYAVDGKFTAQVQVSVQSPLAFDRYTIPPDGQQRTLDVLTNDPFWPGYAGAREITAVSVGSADGAIVISPDKKSILYTPPDGAYGEETFIYIVDDIYPAQVKIEIPVTLNRDQFEFVQHDPPATLNVLANDPFWPGYTGDSKITHVTASRVGASITISPDGKSIVYTQPADFGPSNGSTRIYDSFNYVVDGQYEADVTVVLHRPVNDDWFEVDQNSTSFFYNVTANDTYRDLSNHVRDVIDRVTSVAQSEKGGTVAISPDGRGILYSPPAGFSGNDTFTYIADGKHKATVNVQVTRPVRDDHIGTGVYQDTPGGVLDVLSNDFLGNGYAGPRIITAVGATQNGGVVTIRSDGKALLYTPAPGYTGSDTFSYTVDGTLTANVNVYVRPLAESDSYTFCPDPAHAPYLLEVLANDNFNNGYAGPGVITAVELLDGSGQIVIQNGKSLSFDAASAGWHNIRYTVDGKYEATVSVSIRNLPDPDQIVVDQNSLSRSIDVLANDFDPEIYYYHCPAQNYPGPRIITAVTQSVNGGVVTIAANGRSVNYQPPADFFGRDSFTYTVDGFMTGTVSVEVIRRVRDDTFRVDAADGQQSLPVLANDLFGANYSGPGQITGVTATLAGGTATIGNNRHAIVYTPPAGFVGRDTFTYTVDGVLKAEVTVVVDAPATDQHGTFDSVEDYTQFLLDDALERYQYLFGQTAWSYLGPPGFPEVFANNGPSADRNHSETNVQVAGVDEGDIMEFDDDYIYTLNSSEVVIVDAWPAEELSLESHVDIEGRPLVEFLHGDRLTVISETGGYIFLPFDPNPLADVGRPFVGDSIFPFPYSFQPFSTIVTVIDVSDRAAPTIVQTTTMEGKYIDSRGVGDFVYVLVSNANAVAQPPEIIDEDNDPMTPGRYETKEEFIARVSANAGQFVEGALPNYTSYGPDGEVARTGLLNMPEDVYEPLVPESFNLISVVSFNVEGDEPGLADSAAAYSTGASAIYASLEYFYVFDRDYSSEDGAITRIVKFDWEPATGGIEFAATTAVAGTILNQFSADENGPYLRIATTVSNDYSGNWSGRDENMLFVLQEDDGVFEFVGSLQNLALNETMRSVRFLGDRVFVTTFRDVDPLFAIDLTNPANPISVGHITLPGFTSYMHLVDENYLLTVGRNTPVGNIGPTQVSLFDITNLQQPRRIAEYTFARFSTSEAELDHHAFGYYAEHGLLGMPVARVFVERVDQDGDGYRETRRTVQENLLAVFSVDATATNPAARLVLSGEIEHDTPVRRSGYIGDKLYSIASDSIKVVDVAALNTVIATVVTLPLPEEDDDPPPPPPVTFPSQYSVTTEQLLGRFPALRPDSLLLAVSDRARQDLATRLDLDSGAPMLVSAEAAPEAPGGGYQLAFRVGEDHYLYRAGTNGNVQLVDDDYDFSESAGAWHAVSSFVVTPPAGLTGDYNSDGRVDQQDHAAWRANFGAWSLTSYLPADGNHDGNVDAADYAVWRNNRGAVAVASVAGDFDSNGGVDQADYDIWRSTFGSTTDLRADANRNNEIDTADYAVWRRARNATAVGQALDDLLLLNGSALGTSTSSAAGSALSGGTDEAYLAVDGASSDDGFEAVDAALESIASASYLP